ncbi:c-type cytochrome [Pseudomonas putida]|uniref:C-type cytochrome n=1 Tax=Pseudomonas putida TaxID=303 RepID=A0AAP9SP45_PSEPU|nr:cytochrome c [Pseudomonas putida]QJQ10256.1 c-type cytochrome [Pseudomonas putida]
MLNKKTALIGGGVLALAGAVMLGQVIQANSTARSKVADDTVRLGDFKSTDAALIKQGEYVMRGADCAACHTAKSGDFAGGYVIGTPFGDIQSSNITPDRETGIGNYTQRDFFNAVRQGQGRHGLLFPAMPYTDYTRMSDDDLRALWAYFSTIEPKAHKVDELSGMNFPFNQRLLMAGWNWMFFDNQPYAPDPAQSVEWNRGRYLVDGAGHCAACHSPRNALGGPIASQALQGGLVGTWFAPNITNDPHQGLGDSTVEQIVDYLKTGSDGVAVASGPMAEAIENSTQHLTEQDLRAIAVYLKSLPGTPQPAPQALAASDARMQRGGQGYEVHCSACHGTAGEGVSHMITGFAGNKAILATNTDTLTSVVLGGARAVHTHTYTTGAGMPAFDWKLSDSEIADILTFARNSWGNSAQPVTAAEVTKMRKQLELPEQMRASVQ